MSAACSIAFFVDVPYAFMRKESADDNPWGEGASTLECTFSSPSPFHSLKSRIQ